MRNITWVSGCVVLLVWTGCSRTTPSTGSSGTEELDAGPAGRSSAAGSGGSKHVSQSTGAGSKAPGSTGATAGSSGSGGRAVGTSECPQGATIPTTCKTCPNGECGAPVCRDGKFTGEFACDPESTCDCARGAYFPVCGSDGTTYDATCGRNCVPVPIACDGECPCQSASGGCKPAGCSGQLCAEASLDVGSTCEWREEYACYRSASCERQSDGNCGWTSTPELTACLQKARGGGSNLRWYMTCGQPVCQGDALFDDPNIPNCTSEKLGESCSSEGKLCDGVASCGAKWICATSDPTQAPAGCPISRARFKEAVQYLSAEELRSYRDELLRMRLAAYRYKHAPEAGPQLGFIIDDVEPSAAVSGDHVNMYGYLSMAVAAIQDQQRQIDALEHELSELRARTGSEAICEP